MPLEETDAQIPILDRPVRLRGIAEAWGVFAHFISIVPEDLGRTLRVSAAATSPAADHLFLSIECKIAGEPVELVRQPWPVNPNSFTRIEVEAPLPYDLDPNSLRVKIALRNVEGVVYNVRDVRAILF